MKKSTRLGLLVAVVVAASMHVILGAQGAGQNINVVTGSADQFTGDMFRQRQNEGVVGISSVNPSNMVVAYNDYRTVDIADDQGVGTISPAQGFVATLLNFFRAPWRLGREREEREGETETDGGPAAAQAWIGLSFTNNGGKSWYSGLFPGRFDPTHSVPIPPDTDPALADTHLMADYDAASDPVIAVSPNQVFLGGIAFNPPPPAGDGRSIGFFSRFTDRNQSDQSQTLHFDGTKVLLSTASGATFVDKPSIAAGPNGRVYMAFVVFDQQDPQKLSSKILFFRSADAGATWAGPVVVSQPLSRNQAPWIVVDPFNENIVYIGWRVFSIKTGGWANAIVGRKSTNGGQSFTPALPYPVALLLKPFDQPQGNLSGPNPTPPVPRSSAYPTAAIDGKGAIHVAIQEYVYPSTHPLALLRGLPLLPGVSTATGVPRITVTTSYDGGASWTTRKAADLGTNATRAGSQFMPVLAAAGEPGPSCPGSSGPRSRVMLMYYDARAGGIGRTPGGPGYVAGGDKQFDVRIAQASACSNNGLTFSPSEQVSQYTRSSEAPFDIVTTAGSAGSAVNRAYSAFCGGNCAFSGDYIHMSPRVPYIQTVNGVWKPTTAVTGLADRNKLPAPVMQTVFADTRDIVTPSTGPLRPVPPGASAIDALPWNVYGPPGTGMASCLNPGSRDQNLYTAEYAPGGLFALAPVTFRTSSIPRSYPIFVENRTPQTKYYRVSIDPLANASFDFTDFDGPGTPQDPKPNFGEPYARVTNLVIGSISSVTGTVVVGIGVTQPILITIEETTAPVVDSNGNTTEGGQVIAPPAGAKTSVTLYPSGTDPSGSETFVPVIDPTPIVTKPFDGQIPAGGLVLQPSPATIPSPTPFSPNPFSPNPFSPNPFSPNPFSPNPFSPNPFSPNPFSPNEFPSDVVVHDVTDFSYVVTNQGEQTAAFNALTNVANAQGRHVFQLLLNRAVPTPVLNASTCEAFDSWQAVPISTIANPFSPNPFSPNPFSPNPFSPNPFSPNPFSPNPFPLEFSNATFYVKPSEPAGGLAAQSQSYVAQPGADVMVITIRDWLITNPAIANDPIGQPVDVDNIEVEVKGQVPEQPPGGGYEDELPATGTQVPHHLAFTVQPTSTSPGAPITPAVRVAVQDVFGDTVSDSTAAVTIAIGANPALEGVLSGTLTVNAVSGIATFSDLSINVSGSGYTLVASSGDLAEATSEPFTISPQVMITTQALPDATAGEQYSQHVFASDGTGPYTWSIDAIPNYPGFKLPPGLELNSETGVISGMPDLDTAETAWTFRLRVTDAFGQSDTQDICIHVDVSIAGALVAVAVPVANADDVAQEIVGDGVTIVAGSVQFSGAAAALGTFTGGFSATGLTRGIILSSGAVTNVNPPNTSDSIEALHGLPGDPDLQALIGTTPTRDAAVLQFDFTVDNPNATVVKFDYVFASDEYNEYAGSDFNDVFGLFLSQGDGPRTNLALIPGTEGTPVSINTVNNGGDPAVGGNPTPQHPEFFVNNDPTDIPLELRLGTQADGLTKVLSVQAAVVPGQTYRLKLAIADAFDTRFDSWVLFKRGSLTVVCPIIPNCPSCGQ